MIIIQPATQDGISILTTFCQVYINDLLRASVSPTLESRPRYPFRREGKGSGGAEGAEGAEGAGGVIYYSLFPILYSLFPVPCSRLLKSISK